MKYSCEQLLRRGKSGVADKNQFNGDGICIDLGVKFVTLKSSFMMQRAG